MRLSFKEKIIGCVLAFALACFLVPSLSFGYDIQIDVAPNVLNIESESTVVTVHTDIAYGDVVGSSVFLNGVSIFYWKADARGNFVAKFVSDDIKTLDGLNIGDYNELTLIGYDINGESFIGTQEIKVIEIIPQGK